MMSVKMRKVASKLLTEEAKHVGRWSRGQTRRLRQGTQGMLARELASHVNTGVHKYARHVDTEARMH